MHGQSCSHNRFPAYPREDPTEFWASIFQLLLRVVSSSARYDDPIFGIRRWQTLPILAEIRSDRTRENVWVCFAVKAVFGRVLVCITFSDGRHEIIRPDQRSPSGFFQVQRCIRLSDGFRLHFELVLQRFPGNSSENRACDRCSVAAVQLKRCN